MTSQRTPEPFFLSFEQALKRIPEGYYQVPVGETIKPDDLLWNFAYNQWNAADILLGAGKRTVASNDLRLIIRKGDDKQRLNNKSYGSW